MILYDSNDLLREVFVTYSALYKSIWQEMLVPVINFIRGTLINSLLSILTN